MARYLRKLTHVGSAGPTEERGFAIWAGYDIVGVDDDLTELGLIRVDDWPEERIAEHGVTRFVRVEPHDHALRAKLGLQRNE